MTSSTAKCYAIGNWMIDAAIRGALDQFPYANKNPSFKTID